MTDIFKQALELTEQAVEERCRDDALECIPEYFAKSGITEALAQSHPVLLVRQMANEILRLRAAQPSSERAVELLRDLLRQIDEFCTKHGEADFYTGDAIAFLATLPQPGGKEGK